MNAQADSCADFDAALLDYAYGELGSGPARSLEAHLQAMGKLPGEPAPAQGLESLLAYAAQAARRRQQPSRSLWKWLGAALPVGGLLALLVVAVTHSSSQGNMIPATTAPLASSRQAPEASDAGEGTPAAAIPLPASPAPAAKAAQNFADSPERSSRFAALAEAAQSAGSPARPKPRKEVAESKHSSGPTGNDYEAIERRIEDRRRESSSKGKKVANAELSKAEPFAFAQPPPPAKGFAPKDDEAERADLQAGEGSAVRGVREEPALASRPPVPMPAAPATAAAAAPAHAQPLGSRKKDGAGADADEKGALGATRDPASEDILDVAARQLAAGDSEGTLQLYRRFLQRYPNDRRAAEVRLALGRALARLGRDAEARHVFEEIGRLHPGTRFARDAVSERRRLEGRGPAAPAADAVSAPDQER